MSPNEKKAKILIFNPYGSNTGGGSQIQGSLMEMLLRCCPGADIQIVNLVKKAGGKVSYLRSFFQALSYYRGNIAADLFILQSCLDPGMAVLGALARRNRTPYILIPGGDLVPSHELRIVVRNARLKSLYWRFIGKRFVRDASAVVVTSELEKERLVKAGIAPGKFHIIPNSLPTQYYDHAHKYLQAAVVPAPFPYALWLGRISDEKGLLFLLECWAKCVLTCPQAKLLLVGPVDHQDTFRGLNMCIISRGLSGSVNFLPWVDEAEKIKLISQARCLLLPSHSESFGITVMEAIIMHTPVIASTGTPWPQIDGVAGRWLPHERELWANAMADYLSPASKQYVDPEKVSGLLSQFTAAKISKKWGALLRDINI